MKQSVEDRRVPGIGRHDAEEAAMADGNEMGPEPRKSGRHEQGAGPPTIDESLRKWLYERLGLKGLLGLAVLSVLASAWWNWEQVQKLPVMSAVIELLSREGPPKADPQRFSIAIAHLENDDRGEKERLISEALREFEGIQVIKIDRTLTLEGTIPEAEEQAGHDQARRYLKATGADILLWGTVLRHDGKSLPKLYWTTARDVRRDRAWGRYQPNSESFELPALFWEDLDELLQLLGLTQYAEFADQQGHYIADQLGPFINKVRKLLQESEMRPGWNVAARASTRHILADALALVGEQKGESAPLEEAVAAYRTALEETPRRHVPLDWAATQNNLGNALRVLGMREPGTARLEEAVAAYRAALKERTRQRVPLDWAATQNNLGAALRVLGERKAGTAHLEEAVAAYRAALEEMPRWHVPFNWAATQNNLGLALQVLGEREAGTAHLVEAVAAYRAALEERTRQRVPLDWAATQNNLGNALTVLGEREAGTAHLEEAVAAYRAALEERSRQRVPLDWAATQNNLGNALTVLGEREEGTAHLEEAVAAYRAALEETPREGVPFDWARTQYNLGNALRLLGEREAGTAHLEEAVAAYRAALEETPREDLPLVWAATRNDMNAVLRLLGEGTKNGPAAEQGRPIPLRVSVRWTAAGEARQGDAGCVANRRLAYARSMRAH
jgi:tetratricopeptide (TPR) repeat protein